MDMNLSLGSWLIPQITLLVIHYGFDKILPWWVLWFPTLIIFAILLIVLIIFFIVWIFTCDGGW